MQVNLRKASALQSEIIKAIAGVKIVGDVTVTEFTTDLTSAIDTARAAFVKAIERKGALNAALYEIRKQVATANAAVGVNDVLNEIKLLEAKMDIFNIGATAQVAKTFDEIHGRVQKIKATAANDNSRLGIYSDRYNNVESPVLRQTEIDEFKAAVKHLKRSRQAMQDKLLTLNVSNNITLSQEVVSLLQEEGIL